MTDGTTEEPWRLTTPSRDTEFRAWFDVVGNVPVLAVRDGETLLHYDRSCIDDLRDMLVARADWVELGAADEQNEPHPGTVEAWARSQGNPRGGWYGLDEGLRGRFAVYVPPVLEYLGMAELEHNQGVNRMRAVLPSPGVSTTVAQLNEPQTAEAREQLERRGAGGATSVGDQSIS
jgi:hypothetical protein